MRIWKKNKYERILNQKVKIVRRCIKRATKCLNKVEQFCQLMRWGFILTLCCRCFYKCSFRLLENEKYHILTSESYLPVSSFDEKVCICDTCYKHRFRNEMPCRAVFNKISLDPISDELKDFKKLEKVSIFKRMIFKK